jgi:hypothetical protein
MPLPNKLCRCTLTHCLEASHRTLHGRFVTNQAVQKCVWQSRTSMPSLAAMRSTAMKACQCGSGLPFSRCHGDPRNRFAREQAVREAESMAMLFPSVRLQGEEVDAFAERAAAAYPDEDPPAHVLDEGLALVDASEQRRLVDDWAEPHADRWRSLTETAADHDAVERAVVKGALRAAIAERQASPHSVVEVLEDGRLRRSPLAALAVVVPPLFVWSRDEAAAAEVAAAHSKPRKRSGVVEGVAYALMTFAHIARTRLLARRLASELPLVELPEASNILSSACDEVERDADAARAATAALLIAYVEQLRASETGNELL